jgi:predicted metal-dependent HD superfamily phosphohydrolase
VDLRDGWRRAWESVGATADGRLDVDLAILGADAARFDEYEKQVREEYRWVPAMLYRRTRKAILQGFLSRPTIYRMPLFIERYERPARENLARSLAKL